MDPGMNSLLKWSVENSAENQSQPPSSADRRVPDAQALQALMGGPTDADLLKASMQAIVSPTESLENKMVAFDNFEQLVESIDNANNLEPLNLWPPLLEQLESKESEMRRMACWCVGTAVQNNPKSQERVVMLNAVPTLVNLATRDSEAGVRRKAAYALSSEIRNCQPALKSCLSSLPRDLEPSNADKMSAEDMTAIDDLIARVRALDHPLP